MDGRNFLKGGGNRGGLSPGCRQLGDPGTRCPRFSFDEIEAGAIRDGRKQGTLPLSVIGNPNRIDDRWHSRLAIPHGCCNRQHNGSNGNSVWQDQAGAVVRL